MAQGGGPLGGSQVGGGGEVNMVQALHGQLAEYSVRQSLRRLASQRLRSREPPHGLVLSPSR